MSKTKEILRNARRIQDFFVSETDPTDGQCIKYSLTNSQYEPSACDGGSITLPASSTDNAIVRWSGTGGDTLQDSSVLIDDNNGITATGASAGHNLDGQSLEIPNAAGGKAALSAAGQLTVDTTSRTLNIHDGTAEVVLNPLRVANIFIPNPIAADDYPFFTFKVASTLVETRYSITGGTNWVGQVQEADDPQGTNAADTQAADSTVTGNTTVTTFSNAGFDAGDSAYLKSTSVSGSVSWLYVQIWFRENA